MKKNKKKKKLVHNFILILYTISNIYLIINIIKLQGIENLLRYLFIIFLLFINIIFLIKRKKKNKIKLITLIILTILFGTIAFFTSKTLTIINNFSKESITYSSSLVTLKENNLKTKDIKTIGIISEPNSIDGYIIPKLIIKENNLTNIKLQEYDDYIAILNDLYENKIDAAFLPSNYNLMFSNIEKYQNINKETLVLITKNKKEKIKPTPLSEKKLTKPFTLLIMGVDSEKDELKENTTFNGDALILITFNPNTLNATMLSIPRDTYVPIACFKNQYENKITHAAWQGESCMIDTIENFIDIDIDYYVKINFKGLVNLVDALDGIEVDVPYSFCEQDSKRRFGKYMIYVEKGLQTINGEQALALARHRKETSEYHFCGPKYLGNDVSDIQRGLNQQLIIKGILNKAKKINNIEDIYNILEVISKTTDTNLSTKNILSLYDVLKNIVVNQKNNTSDPITIQRLYLSGYDQYIYDEKLKLTLYNYIYYRGSKDDIEKEMKINLELIESQLIKTFSYSKDETYEPQIIGKGTYKIVDYINTLPNFIGKTQNEVITWANKNNIKVTFQEDFSSQPENTIINQNYPYGYRVKNIKDNLILTIAKKQNIKEDDEIKYYDCTLEENSEKEECLFPNFIEKDLSNFKNWYNKLSKYNINIPTPNYIEIKEADDEYDDAKKGKIIKQNIKPTTLLTKIETITITYIKE